MVIELQLLGHGIHPKHFHFDKFNCLVLINVIEAWKYN